MDTIPKNLRGQCAVVTGAGSGIGRASAKILSDAGAKIALIGHTEEEIYSALNDLGGEDAGHLPLVADVSDPDQMRQAFERVGDRYKMINIVVANAGINGTWAPLEELDVAEWDKTIATNLRGTFLTAKYALPYMKPLGGSIIVVSSVNGTRIFSNSGATAYSCSKAAQVAFTKMVALELAKDKIRVNVVCPGAIETKIDASTTRKNIEDLHLPVVFPEGDVPLTGGTPGSADQVAQLVWFLASDLSSHITGTEIFIEGAQSLLQG